MIPSREFLLEFGERPVSKLHPAFDPDVWATEPPSDLAQQVAVLAAEVTELRRVQAEQARLIAEILAVWTEDDDEPAADL